MKHCACGKKIMDKSERCQECYRKSPEAREFANGFVGVSTKVKYPSGLYLEPNYPVKRER